MTSRTDSTKRPGKQEVPDGFIDDPEGEDIDKHGRVYRPATHIYTGYSGYDHSEKIDPYHIKETKDKKKGR